ncbi:MAG: glycosyltransferase family 4 protein [Fibrobacteres bacterium]|nr:glycosyltransferase family 4 protein [Fibrobacterota bacterium]
MLPRSILVLTHELPPLGGGAGRAMSQLCSRLAARGIAVEVWTQRPPAPYPTGYPFRVRFFATGRSLQFQTSPATILLFCARALWSGLWLGKRRPDLIFSNTGIPTGALGALLARFHRVPHAIWYHGADVHENRRTGAGPLYRLALKAAWSRTDMHGFVSRGLLAMAEGYGGMRGARMVLPLFGDPPRAEATAGHPIAPVPATSVPPTPPAGAPVRTFLFTGRLEAVKDPFLFLSAIAWLRTSGRLPADTRFRIVGGGSLYAPVRRRILAEGLSAIVALEPPVPGEAMAALYAGAFALVLTSVVEGFPLTVLEAAMHGVPAAGPDTLGVNEEIEDGATGLLFARDDAEACGRALLRLMEEEGLRDRLGEGARKAAGKLSAERTADLFLEAIRTLPG